MSVQCPNCNHANFDGALFCAECGTKLVTEDGLSTASVRPTDASKAQVSGSMEAVAPPPAIQTSDALISLHVVRTGQILPLVGRDEFTVGRVSEGQSILPDIDLTPYDAYSQGVSRLHATIKLSEDHILLIDLGSSNGTRLNNEKLQPHREYELRHGDMVALGRFKLQALVRQD
ncbi:MAG: FHA domain-containing protein [Anaerolineae bacterium]|nr:MAG: FHA domain-containing protein [Anaerolineae bacterium]